MRIARRLTTCAIAGVGIGVATALAAQLPKGATGAGHLSRGETTRVTTPEHGDEGSPLCVPGGAGAADYTRDGAVDLDDHRALVACLAGPNATSTPGFPVTATHCLTAFDADTDGDIDLVDVAEFYTTFTGPCAGLAACPPGTVRRHASGTSDNPDIDTFDPQGVSPYDFECVPAVGCTGIACSGNGTCQIVDGQPACACAPGYAGADCEHCAPGYESDGMGGCILGAQCRATFCAGQGDCVDTGIGIACVCDPGTSGTYCEDGIPVGQDPLLLRPPTYVVIEGTDQSIPRDGSVRLTITPFGGGNIDTDFVWTLTGPGSLDTNVGSTVLYTAPADDGAEQALLVQIDVAPASFPALTATRFLTIDPVGGIPSMGQSSPALKPIDDAVRSFMWHRCIGGAVVGVSFFGEVIHVKGFGNMSGAATNDPDYLTRCGDTFDVSNLLPDHPLPSPAPVQPNTPFRIGSCSKPVAAAVLRKVVRESGVLGPDPDESDIEAALLCFEPFGLLPPEIYDVLCNGMPPLLPLPDDDDDANFCPDLSVQADWRWPDVRLRHLMGHRSGLNRGAPSTVDTLTPAAGVLRGAISQSDWEAQEVDLTSECGFDAGCFDDEFASYPSAKALIGSAGAPGYFVPRVNPSEVVEAMAGTCLQFTPGMDPADFDVDDSYSNEAYHFIGAIVEHMTGTTFAGRTGRPGLHGGSALEAFLTQNLGLPLPGQGTPEGIFKSQGVYRLHGDEPIYRTWGSGVDRYYWQTDDEKRPYCIWTGGACGFLPWKNGAVRFDWDFELENPLYTYAGDGRIWSGAGGGLAAEAAAMLRFMATHWVGGSGTDPRYGEPRCPDGNCVWTTHTVHNGSVRGGYAYTIQLGGPVDTGNACSSNGDCAEGQRCLGGLCRAPNKYTVPPIDPCTNDYHENWGYSDSKQCWFPVGVDIFVALNQRSDKICADAEALGEGAEGYFTCSDAYGRLDDFIYDGVCHIQWPPNPYVFWPPVTPNGGSGLTVVTPDAPLSPVDLELDLADGGIPCCGDGVRDPGQLCDGTDFGGLSCASFGYEMGDLICGPGCQSIDTSGCSGGISTLPPASYGDCGYNAAACNNDPSMCFAAGDCPGGPCARTDPGDYDGALFDPFNFQGEFHPDGNFRDEHGNLYFCRDDTPHGEMVCINDDGWGVCRKCEPGGGPLRTGIGCSCGSEGECDALGTSLGCFGEEFGPGVGFCWDNQDGPPPWQCEEGICGTAPWYGNDNTYCEHYSESGKAECEPWYACNPILARICAGEGLICEEDALGCTSDDCCTSQCLTDADCTPAYGWPAGYSCENTNQGLRCVGP